MTTFSLQHVPFSFFGSYLSVSSLREGMQTPSNNLYLRTHHGGVRAVLQLHVTHQGESVSPHTHATPHGLRLEHDRGWAELSFDGADALRLRGVGLGLRLQALLPTVAYQTDPGSVTFNVLAAREQYRLGVVAGRLQVRGLYRAGGREETNADTVGAEVGAGVVAGAGERWEASLHVFKSTFEPRALRSFDVCVAENRAAFARWLEGLPRAPSEHEEARALAGYVTFSGVVAPAGLFKRPAMLMSKNWMDRVWSWDHCFNALALAPGHPELAWDQLLLMADQQDAYGAYPDAYNDTCAVYNFAKPPVHGWAVGKLLNRAEPPRATLETLYTSLSRWTNWWLTYRVLPGERLPYYLHGNDSGWDNSTAFDEGVPLMTADLSAFLVLQLDALGALARRLGVGEPNRWSTAADALTEQLLHELWQDDHFVAKHADGRRTRSHSLLHCMPIVLGERLPRAVREQLAENIALFLTDYGLATERPTSEAYQADGYWRGPVWAPSTYLVVTGLERSGFPDLARDVAKRFCATCKQSGFAENFDARTGEGLRDRAYTWTASVFLLLAEKLRASY